MVGDDQIVEDTQRRLSTDRQILSGFLHMVTAHSIAFSPSLSAVYAAVHHLQLPWWA